MAFLALLAFGLATVLEPVTRPTTCEFTTAHGSVVALTPEQAGHAATIAAVAARRALPQRAATIGIATAIQESKLRNLPGGDRDSLGLFQQRPSQGWGTPQQIRDPVYAAERFYAALAQVKGWESLPLTEAAQRVQRSAFPTAYAAHEDEADVYAQALTGTRPAAVACRLGPVTRASSLSETSQGLQRETGFTAEAAERALTFSAESGTRAAGAAAWAVANADRYGITAVTLGDLAWRRAPDDESLRWGPAQRPLPAGAVRIDVG